MLKAFKTEIDPTSEQKRIINNTIGVCRYVYNLYITHNKEDYKAGNPFMDNYEFSKWLNNVWLPSHPENIWIKDVSSKAVKQSIGNAYKAFKRFSKVCQAFLISKRKGSLTLRCIS